MKELVQQLVSEQKEQMFADRHYLHMHPELSFEEYETSKWIKDNLAKLNIPLQEGITGTSVVGVLKGDQPGPTIMFRADFDALPVNEENDLPYKSTVPNVMHACGHDTHCATLMALARVMSSHKDLVRGTIKFVFQCGEEKLPGGAIQLCKDGVMKDVDYGFGMHSAAGLEVGKIQSGSGAISAAVATYEIKVTGKGGHGSREDKAVNPLPIACAIGSAINQITTETVSPLDACTITVAYMHCGQYPNIIPGEAVLGGNIRILNNDLMDPIIQKIDAVSKGIAAAWGAETELSIIKGYPADVNDKALTDVAFEAIEEMGYEGIHMEPSLGAEDFAYYAMEKPCTFIHVGGAVKDKPETYNPHHSKGFQVVDDLMPVALECEIAWYLKMTKQG